MDQQSEKYWFADWDEGCQERSPRALTSPPTGHSQHYLNLPNPEGPDRSGLKEGNSQIIKEGPC